MKKFQFQSILSKILQMFLFHLPKLYFTDIRKCRRLFLSVLIKEDLIVKTIDCKDILSLITSIIDS